jgi:enoyl-[acyl-carrier protein] reductase I
MAGLLAGKTALIAGIANTRSLAYAIAQSFVREGASLILTYLNDKQRDTIGLIAGDMRVERLLPCDVLREEDIAALGAALGGLGRPVDAFVHSLAFANREDLARPFVETEREGFLLAHNVSAYSLVAMSRAVAPAMTKGGSIITLTYVGSTRVRPNYNVMGVAKAALEASTRYLANDLGPSGIRVNAISAGAVKTVSARAVKDLAVMLEATRTYSPLRRVTDPAEVGDAAAFLASDLSRGITGTVLFVDSGMQLL